MAEVLVLGAGMVGIGTALALQARGHRVRVIDKRAPGQETSYGNAGVIQAEAHTPYAMPRGLSEMWTIARGQTNDVLFDWAALPGLARALALYFHQSAPARHGQLSKVYAPLTARATRDHGALIQAAEAHDLVRRTGLGEIYETPQAFDAAARSAEDSARTFGLSLQVLDGNGLRRAENALTAAPAGAVVWDDSWSCTDPGALVTAYALLFQSRGGEVLQGAVADLAPTANGWTVKAGEQSYSAAHLVIAAGPWSPRLLAPLGYRVPMIYKRGYHGHFQMDGTLTRPYLLADHGVVAASMAQGLRLTTGAHLTQLDAPRNLQQLEIGKAGAARLMNIGAAVPDALWHGTRPCLPDMLPLVGAAPRHKGLWVNFGHGHQGFTLGPTTGALLAEMLDGTVPQEARALDTRSRLS